MSSNPKPVSPQECRLKGFSSKAIHTGYCRRSYEGAPVAPPIVNSTTYEYETIDFPRDGYGYSRHANPTRNILEKTLAALDNAKYGLCYGSGMAAIFAACAFLTPGDHVICAEVVYGGVNKQFRTYFREKGVEVTFIHPMTPDNAKKAIKSNTKLVFLDCPANPLLTIVDLKGLSDVLREHPGIVLVVDNTFMTPYFQKPLEHGVDVVVYSLTKYMNGHGDVVMGAVTTNREDLYLKMKDIQSTIGPIPSPFDCFLVTRGLKTLQIRMKEHQNNAFAVAKFLEGHECIENVLYPGLPSHPQHEIAKKQCKGYSGMLSFYTRGGSRREVEILLEALKLVTCTGSLGQTQSLVCCPATVSHHEVHEEDKKRIGITDNLVRMSVGLEDPEDIINDLKQALEKLKRR